MDKINTSTLGIGVGIFAALQLANTFKNKNGVSYMRASSGTDNINGQNVAAQTVTGTDTTNMTMTPGIELSDYTSNRYQIGFKYPSSWRKNPRYEDKYEGESGYFEIGDFTDNGDNIDQAVEDAIDEEYKPYGSNPTVRRFVVDGQPARVIYSSEDQSDFFNDRDVAIIVQYPQPLILDNVIYKYVIIWTTPDYVPLITSTFKFIGIENDNR